MAQPGNGDISAVLAGQLWEVKLERHAFRRKCQMLIMLSDIGVDCYFGHYSNEYNKECQGYGKP